MKIHMDNLEAKVEQYSYAKVRWDSEKRAYAKKVHSLEEESKRVKTEMEAELARVKEDMKMEIE